ncbi:MAG: GGDEF domain-containing protein [Bacilli bacterium]|nr:GGDEF domain-containing protein [Bacilli bacterium]
MSKTKRKFRFPIEVKAILLIAVLAAVIVEIAVAFYALTSSKTNKNESANAAVNLSLTIAKTIDGAKVDSLRGKIETILNDPNTQPVFEDDWGSEAWNTYIHRYDAIYNEPEYVSLLSYLRDVASANTTRTNDVNCIYILFVTTVSEIPCNVYLADSAAENQYPIGCLDTLLEQNKNLIEHPELGFPPFEFYNDQDGWLITAGSPIYYNNKVVGYSLTDISMAAVRASQAQNIINLFLYLSAAIVFVMVVGIVIIHFVFVRPVKKLIKVSSSYDQHNPEKTHANFVNLEIKTYDEISDLANSMKMMEGDVYRKITELTEMNKELVESQNQTKKMTALAKTDGLTGVQNKSAYLSELEKIDSQIKAGKKVAFAIAMVDLNYLKSTNDEFGHGAGDEALIQLSGVICEVFKHSPVYRVGGDEFAIILRKKDFDNRDELINKFNEQIKKCINDVSHEAISAAIGYAVYDPEIDTCVDDVFKRADKAMYERKHRMKEDK